MQTNLSLVSGNCERVSVSVTYLFTLKSFFFKMVCVERCLSNPLCAPNPFLFFFFAFSAINPGLVEAIVWTAAKHNNGVCVNKGRIKCQEISRRPNVRPRLSPSNVAHTPGLVARQRFPWSERGPYFPGAPLKLLPSDVTADHSLWLSASESWNISYQGSRQTDCLSSDAAACSM